MTRSLRAGVASGLDLLFRIWEWQLESRAELSRSEQSYYLREDAELQAAARASAAGERIGMLRKLLRTIPYWPRGHFLLGESSLDADDVATAYASAQAVLKLAPPGELRGAGSRLLGRCHLRRGDPDRAAAIFEELLGSDPRDYQTWEELAACHLAKGDKERARAALSEIPADKLTAPARAALVFSSRRDDSAS